MTVTIEVKTFGFDNLRLAIREWEKDFSFTTREGRSLFVGLGRQGRDLVRRNITTQGDGSWKPLSKWTRAKTGRRKALITERNRIKFRVKRQSVEIGYEQRETGWNLTSHHKGFTTRGFKGKKAVIPLKNPGALKFKGGDTITLLSAKPSVIPARNVWTTPRKIMALVVPTTSKWTNRILEKRATKKLNRALADKAT